MIMKRMKLNSVLTFIGVMFFGMGLLFFLIGCGIRISGITENMADSSMFSGIYMLIGGIFIIIGGSLLIVMIIKKKKRNQLMQQGDKLDGIITNVVMNTMVRVNGYHPYKAEVEVINHFDGQTYLYSSDNVTQDISYLIGETVNVYVEHNNPKNYFVDLDELMNRHMTENKIIDYRK